MGLVVSDLDVVYQNPVVTGGIKWSLIELIIPDSFLLTGGLCIIHCSLTGLLV